MKKIPRTFLLGLVKNSQVTIFFDSVAVSFCCSPVFKKTNFLRFFFTGGQQPPTLPLPHPPNPSLLVGLHLVLYLCYLRWGGWSKNGTGGLNFLVELGGLNIFRGGALKKS